MTKRVEMMRVAFCTGVSILLVSLTLCMLPDQRFRVFAAGIERDPAFTMIVRSSPDAAFGTRQTLRISGFNRILKNAVHEKAEFSPFLTDVYINVPQNTEQRVFRLEQSGHMWDEKEGKRFVLPRKLADKLLSQANLLRSRHFGELIPWEEADRIAVYKSIFSIKDLETGLSFRVQRRAGRDHADVQPLTREDTKVLKQIYDDRWSWKRKAVIVESGGRRLAASMNGMPHGGDGIPDNGFSGHFCIHFLNSSTHRAEDPDPAHQFMVHKSAGHTRAFLDAASPIVLADTLVNAIQDRDTETFRHLFEGMEKEQADLLIRQLNSLESLRKIKLRELTSNENPLTAAVELQLELRQKEETKEKTVFQFIFIRQTPYSAWRFQVQRSTDRHHDFSHNASLSSFHGFGDGFSKEENSNG